jgi:hypothetical protein
MNHVTFELRNDLHDETQRPLAISNWVLRRDDQVGCVLFTPLDKLEAQRLG